MSDIHSTACQTSSNPLSLSSCPTPVKPIAVHLVSKERFVSAEKPVDVECKSTGARPEAQITWWMGGKQIQRLAKHVSFLD